MSEQITESAELRELYGEPNIRAANKVLPRLDEHWPGIHWPVTVLRAGHRCRGRFGRLLTQGRRAWICSSA